MAKRSRRLPTAEGLAETWAEQLLGQFKAEAGSNVCVYASSALAALLREAGYSARLLAVTALFCEERYRKQLFDPAAEDRGTGSILQRRFDVSALGGYDNDVQPIPGVSRLPDMPTAAHVVVLLERPRVLLDPTADQVKAPGALLMPSLVSVDAPADFPDKEPRLVARPSPGLLGVYDWIAKDQVHCPERSPNPETVQRWVRDLRDQLSR